MNSKQVRRPDLLLQPIDWVAFQPENAIAKTGIVENLQKKKGPMKLRLSAFFYISYGYYKY